MWRVLILTSFGMSVCATPVLAALCTTPLLNAVSETLTYQISHYLPPNNPSRIGNFWKDAYAINDLFVGLKNRVQAPAGGPIAKTSIDFLAQNFHGHVTVNAVEAIYEAIDNEWLSPTEGRVRITYSLRCKDDPRFYLEISDNGSGITLTSLTLMAERRCGTTKKDPWQFPGGRGLGVSAYCLREINKEGDRCVIETHREGVSYRVEIDNKGYSLTTLPKSDQKGTVFRFEIRLGDHHFDFENASLRAK